MTDAIADALVASASPERAVALARFFKTGPGQYGAGDRFLGLTVPQVRAVIRRYPDAALEDAVRLLASPFHEVRLCGVLLMVRAYERGDMRVRQRVVGAYLRHTDRINNWDLVDLSAPRILGDWLLRTRASGAQLNRLVRSRSVWRRRIAVLATFPFISAGRPLPTFNIARALLDDGHDLIHKAVGWMLREVGKCVSREAEEEFLRTHYRRMPRTMLRYAIEQFPVRLRRAYLAGRV